MSDSDKTGAEVLTTLVGAIVLVFGVEAATWWVAHQFAWWTFALLAGGGALAYQGVKAGAKVLRAASRKRRAARRVGERILSGRPIYPR